MENSISPIQQYSYTQGKNATDSAMIIDAMDILYSGKVDGFCLVSSDSDFTRLASRLRESGQNVIGMGEKKTPTPFRQACNIFTTLELLLEDEALDKEEKETAHAAAKKTHDGKGREAHAQTQKQAKEKGSISRSQIEEALIKIITENQNNGRETGLAEVGSRLLKLYPDFDVRSYGYSMLYKFLETFPKLCVERDGLQMYVTLYEDPNRREDLEKFIVEQIRDSGENGLSLGSLGQRIHSRFKDFQVRDYGYSQLKNYIGSIANVHTVGEGSHIRMIYEEEKPRQKRKGRAKRKTEAKE